MPWLSSSFNRMESWQSYILHHIQNLVDWRRKSSNELGFEIVVHELLYSKSYSTSWSCSEHRPSHSKFKFANSIKYRWQFINEDNRNFEIKELQSYCITDWLLEFHDNHSRVILRPSTIIIFRPDGWELDSPYYNASAHIEYIEWWLDFQEVSCLLRLTIDPSSHIKVKFNTVQIASGFMLESM